jgi:conjugal transfer/entry exclusion protein
MIWTLFCARLARLWRFTRLITLFSTAAGLWLLATPAPAQFVVNDPQNGLVLISQRLNQLTQIQNQVTSLEYQVRNLRAYSQNWGQISSEILALRNLIARNPSKVNDAQAQLSQLTSELGTLGQLQAMSNGAQGQLQATQATNMLVAQLVAQLQKQRAMAALEEAQNYQNAYQRLFASGTSALQGRL